MVISQNNIEEKSIHKPRNLPMEMDLMKFILFCEIKTYLGLHQPRQILRFTPGQSQKTAFLPSSTGPCFQRNTAARLVKIILKGTCCEYICSINQSRSWCFGVKMVTACVFEQVKKYINQLGKAKSELDATARLITLCNLSFSWDATSIYVQYLPFLETTHF